jgi:hypothetical protein
MAGLGSFLPPCRDHVLSSLAHGRRCADLFSPLVEVELYTDYPSHKGHKLCLPLIQSGISSSRGNSREKKKTLALLIACCATEHRRSDSSSKQEHFTHVHTQIFR